jgi:hypothetical protein
MRRATGQKRMSAEPRWSSVSRGMLIRPIRTLALYTTVYPGVERFLPAWYRSVCGQTDPDFCLWIGLDGMGVRAAKDAMGGDPDAVWVTAPPGDSPAQIRQRALERIVECCDAVVLVDSDDVLHPCRLAEARVALQSCDLAGCALRMVDEQGVGLGVTFGLPCGVEPEDVLPRNNVFGLSNSAFRSDLLRRCLPIPAACVLVDWFLATRAWLSGASLTFSPEAGMDYRQHSRNTARVSPPFGMRQTARDTEYVRGHFRILQTAFPEGSVPDRLAEVHRVAADIEAFHRQVVLRPANLRRYVEAINALDLTPLWWSCVAHPALRFMWAQQKETA